MTVKIMQENQNDKIRKEQLGRYPKFRQDMDCLILSFFLYDEVLILSSEGK